MDLFSLPCLFRKGRKRFRENGHHDPNGHNRSATRASILLDLNIVIIANGGSGGGGGGVLLTRGLCCSTPAQLRRSSLLATCFCGAKQGLGWRVKTRETYPRGAREPRWKLLRQTLVPDLPIVYVSDVELSIFFFHNFISIDHVFAFQYCSAAVSAQRIKLSFHSAFLSPPSSSNVQVLVSVAVAVALGCLLL